MDSGILQNVLVTGGAGAIGSRLVRRLLSEGASRVLGPVFFRHFEELWAPTFLMHEEYFLSKQLSDKSLRIYYEPSIKVLHHFNGAIGALGNRKAWRLARDAHKIRRQYVKVFS